jgi:RecA-family ATPase
MDSLFATLRPEGHPIYLASLPNERGKGQVYHEYARNEADLRRFISNYDRPGRALYLTVAHLKDGTSRRKENVQSVSWVWAEVDFKDHPEIPPEEIRKRIEAMPYPPTIVVASGHGFHCYWKLNEATDAAPGKAQRDLEDALKLACAYIGGDTNAAEAARLLRLPGSHNSKEGDSVPVSILIANNCSYEMSDLVDFWLEAQPIMPAPVRTNGHGGGAKGGSAGDDGPFDFESRWANAGYKAPGRNCIHFTQLQHTGARLNQGVPLLDVMSETLELTRKAVADDPRCADWNWAKEEREVERMCTDLINEDHTLAPCLPDPLWEKFQAVVEAGNTPKVSRNAAGLHVREYKGASPADREDNASAKTEQPHPNGKRVLVLHPFAPFNVASLPPRTWLYGKHYQRRTVSLTAGPGGMGKSSLDLVEAIAMATCRNLLGEQPEERLRVWYHNGEDPLDEINRRIAAICQHYNIPQEELAGQLWVTSGNEFPLRVAKGYTNLEINAVLVRQISAAITDNQIDLAVFDPLVTLHSVSEVDSGKMDTVIRLFAGIGDETNAGIELAHHMRKPAAGTAADYDVHDIRGVAAITDAVRAARVLNRMNEKDAEAAGCTEVERMSRFRVDRAKGNYSPAQAATWRQFVSIELANGDDVGVVTPWNFPGQGEHTPEKAAADLKAEQVFLQLLDKFLARGMNVSANRGPTHAPSIFAEEQEAKKAKVSKAALKAAMSRLLDSGRVRTESAGKGNHYSRLVAWQEASPK